MNFFDSQQQYANIHKKIQLAIKRAFKHGQFVMGEEVSAFEQEMAAYFGVRNAIALNSGTDALWLVPMALGIGRGDEVITSPFTMIASIQGSVLCGAKPVFIDIDSRTFNIDVDKIEEKITKKTKAIIPVHLYGQPVPMDKVLKIAKKHGLSVIEDAAQACGAAYKNKFVGSFGQAGCLSFYPTKNLGAYGDGGMVLTDDDGLAEKIRLLRVHGAKDKYRHVTLGVNSRLDGIQAAILRTKLPFLEYWNDQRRKLATRYGQGLHGIRGIRLPQEFPHSRHIYHQYTIRTEQRDELKNFLAQAGIPTMVYYPRPLHLQPVFKNLNYHLGDLPEAERACQEVLSLPIYPELSKSDQSLVIKKIKEFYQHVPR